MNILACEQKDNEAVAGKASEAQRKTARMPVLVELGRECWNWVQSDILIRSLD